MSTSMDRWRGKVAVVTGASSGIGSSLVENLVEQGLIVVGLARRSERVEELAKKLSGKKGKLYAFKTDISKEEDIIKAFQWINNKLGPVHILINNAGLMQPTTLTEGDTAMWKIVLDTNILGLSIATREAFKSMKANNVVGHIVHINSIVGHTVLDLPMTNMYAASKFAVTALTETLRLELIRIGSKIKVTSVSPGPVNTEMAVSQLGTMVGKEVVEKMSFMYPQDITDAVLYALSTPPHVQVQELTIRPIETVSK